MSERSSGRSGVVTQFVTSQTPVTTVTMSQRVMRGAEMLAFDLHCDFVTAVTPP